MLRHAKIIGILLKMLTYECKVVQTKNRFLKDTYRRMKKIQLVSELQIFKISINRMQYDCK